jgi:hypothetical protein
MKVFRFYAGVFLVTASVLMLQIVQARILSVVSWYHLAFFVISLAMFGITAGTVWVYLRRDRFSERALSHDLAYFSAAYAVSNALCLAVQMTLAPTLAGSIATTLVWFEFAICLAIPFFFSGVVVGLALTRSPYPVGRVYGVDLVGAATGCVGVLVLLSRTDGPSAVLWVSALAALAAFCFSGSGIGAAPKARLPFSDLLGRPGRLLIGLLACAVGNGLIPNGLQPIFVKGQAEVAGTAPDYVRWNSFSRIAVLRDTAKAGANLSGMWGPSPAFHPEDWHVERRRMNIDGDAATMAYGIRGDVAKAGFLKYDITNLAYYLPDNRRAAVIGIGGGRDMLSARVFDVPDITGVEINPILMRLLTSEPGYAEFTGLNRLPDMHFYVDEARSWFTRSDQTFDSIQMSLIDTWAATGAGAFTLSESGLYTTEAWRIFLRHLTPHGVLTVSRWYSPANVDETGRMTSLAVASLLDIGASDPARHIFLASTGNIATLIVSRSPFAASDIARLKDVAADMGYRVMLCPGEEPASPVLGRIVSSRGVDQLLQYTFGLATDLSPPTDERPFFFNQLPLYSPGKTIALALAGPEQGVDAGNLAAAWSLAEAVGACFVLVLLTIIHPLHPAIADVGRRLVAGGTAYFLLIGAGFMSVEIGLLQRMTVFLGHPVYSLSVVMFSLILATGLGALVSDRLPLRGRAAFILWSLATAAYVAALPFWTPPVLQWFEGATLPLRALLAVATIAPAGLLMGYGFPTGMRFVSAVDRTPMPWFWGINGAAGVFASSFGVACSMAFGTHVTLAIGGLCYAALIPAGLAIGFRAHAASAPQPA